MKRCSKCGQTKPLSQFHKRAASPDGLAYKCIDCVNVNSVLWRRKNPTAHAEWYQRNKAHKSEYFKKWRRKHIDSEPTRMAEWGRSNLARVVAKNARRRAAQYMAVPKWADIDAVKRIYLEAARLRRETGLKYEVDHIVPLQGKTVCGLHWEGNLRIVTEFENISKHNKHWPDMP